MKRKIRILRIITRLNIGGPAIHAILLTEGLDKDGFETTLAAGRIGGREGDMGYLAEQKGVIPVIIPELGRPLNIYKDMVAFFKLFFLVIKLKPDIIHTHTAKAGALGRMAGVCYNLITGSRCILIHTFHGHIFHSYFSNTKTGLFLWIERSLARFTDRIITIGRRQYEEITNIYRVTSKDSAELIPLGFDLNAYAAPLEKKGRLKRDLRLPPETLLVGMVGRLVPVKNHKLLLKAINRLDGRLKDAVRFTIIGDGELRDELGRYARELNIKDKLVFTGWRRNLHEAYPDLDIVVLTSLNEGTPISLIEAMAAACPVVASDVGGVRDIVDHGRTGLLFEKNDFDGLAGAITYLVENESARISMGREGRNKVKKAYSAERLIGDVEGLYKNLIKKRGKT